MKERMLTDEVYYLPRIEDFTQWACMPEWALAPGQSDEHGLTFVLEGQGEYVVDGVRYPVNQGDLVYIQPHRLRAAGTNPTRPMTLCSFSLQLFDRDFRPAILPLHPVTHLSPDARVSHLLERIRQSDILREPTGRMQATALLMELLARVMQNAGLVESTGSDPRIKRAAAFVMENVSRHLSVGEIGQAVGVHPGYLNKLTTRDTGKTVSRFVSDIRVNMAEEAMMSEGISVSEAALRFGFSDVYHFSKVFKRVKGYPPSTAKTLLR